MGAWTASRLPKIRDGLQRLLLDPSGWMQRGIAEAAGDDAAADALAYNEVLGHGLGAADLFWTCPEMAALAVGAAEDLPEVRWAAEDRPSENGLLVFDGGVGAIAYDGWPVPVDAIAWTPEPGGLLIGFYFRRSRAQEYLAEVGRQVDLNGMPALVPCGLTGVTESAGWQSVKGIHPAERTVLTTLAAAWLLMQQPGIVEHATAGTDRKIQRAYQRSGQSAPQVRLVTLRRQYQVSPESPPDPDDPGRRYRHRWIVRGHWRQQAHGPQRSLRRPTWIPRYLKGPDGAPLLETAKVNVWRR